MTSECPIRWFGWRAAHSRFRNGARAVRAKLREVVKYGADLIKIWGPVHGRSAGPPQAVQMPALFGKGIFGKRE